MGRDALRVGVVGVGSLGHHHARLLREVPGARLMGIYDADAARTAAVGAELGVPVFSSLDALLGEVRNVSVGRSNIMPARTIAIMIKER